MAMRLIDGSELPKLGLGTWRFGESSRSQTAEVDAACQALQMGWRAIDSAEMYGEGGAEAVVGEALRQCLGPQLRREQLFVVSKAYPHNAGSDDLQRACERSLKRLGLAQLDLYLLHWRGSVPLAQTIAGMRQLQQRGLIRHWGVSNFDVEDMNELQATAGGDVCAANQVYYSLSQRGAAFALLPWLRRAGQLAMAYSPIDQGALSSHPGLMALAAAANVSAAQLGLAWVLRHGEAGQVMAIPKAKSLTHLRENLAAASLNFDAALLARLDDLFPPPNHRTPLAMS